MMAETILRLVALAGLLGLTSGCDLLLGGPDLGDPRSIATMRDRFKAIIQAETASPAPLDWGVADNRIWRYPMGPRGIAFCGRPANAPETQRPYQINFFGHASGPVEEFEVETPAHPPGDPPAPPCSRGPFDPG